MARDRHLRFAEKRLYYMGCAEDDISKKKQSPSRLLLSLSKGSSASSLAEFKKEIFSQIFPNSVEFKSAK